MQIIVADTSPVRALEFLRLLHVLESLFTKVAVPPAVATELRKPTSKLKPIDLTPFPFIKFVAPKDRTFVHTLRAQLGPGESEAIALAVEMKADALLIDEADGRQIAIQCGLQIMGVLGILVRAKSAGAIPVIRPLTDKPQQGLRFRIAPGLLQRVLSAAGE